MKKKLGIALREPVKIYDDRAPNFESGENRAPTTEQRNAEEAKNLKSPQTSEKPVSPLLNGKTPHTPSNRPKTRQSAYNAQISDNLKANDKRQTSLAEANQKTARAESAESAASFASDSANNRNALASIANLKQSKTRSAVEMMSERTFEIWKYLLALAFSGENASQTVIVTRAQVMREAKVGSTNTYRLALQKLQELELIKIELRPGVTAGSVFYLTEKGIELARALLDEAANG